MPGKSNGDKKTTALSAELSGKIDVTALASGALLAIMLYRVGMLGHKYIGLHAPLGMIFAKVLVKLAHGVSPRILEGSLVVYKFSRRQ